MRVPVATYRLQFTPSFGFAEAAGVVDYLKDLGITDIYASPVFQAKKGSLHGYDVVDMGKISRELGGEEGFDGLAALLGERGMGWVQDIVPNHMAFDCDNSRLMDVLENGPSSIYAPFFDIDWEHPYESIRGRLLTPFLGSHYGDVLEKGEIRLSYGEEGFFIEYYEHKLPLRIETYADVLTLSIEVLREKLLEDSPTLVKYLGVLYSLDSVASAEPGTAGNRQVQFIRRVLWELYSYNDVVRGHIDANVDAFNGAGGRGDPAALLDRLHSGQWFRLAYWKVASEEINYRRFFNINQLISLRVEDREVFESLHRFILRLIGEGKVTGLRIDHVDGLRDPEGYLRRLREAAGDVYVVAEKILDAGEEIPRTWPVQGTTGYDFLNALNGLFCDGRNRRSINKIYYAFTKTRASFDAIVYEKKKLIVEKHMGGDVDNLTTLLKSVSSRDRHGSDMTRQGLRRALVEVIANFPVYRTYITPSSLTKDDREAIVRAVQGARERSPGLVYELDYIERFLLLETGASGAEREATASFVMRFQQFTGPLMAKGYEDTALYVFNRLVSLNEVGGSPGSFGVGTAQFHRFNRRRARLSPHSMNCTATHDTKRGEDVRARINVLSEIPGEWEAALKRWSRLNRARKRIARGREMPDRNDEYLFYQTLLGTFPHDGGLTDRYRERMRDYAVKAIREAKVHTAWVRPDSAYEEAFLSFIDAVLSGGDGNHFLEDFAALLRRVAYHGSLNSLSQTLLKIASPGVPDFYQGTELEDLRLVDPDNRRPVDFEARKLLLEEMSSRQKSDGAGLISDLLAALPGGGAKLFLICRGLAARKEAEGLFRDGGYIPLKVEGRCSRNVVAFLRRDSGSWALAAAPRFTCSLVGPGTPPCGPGIWGDTHIPLPADAPSRWRNVITGALVEGVPRLPAAGLFAEFPACLLLGE